MTAKQVALDKEEPFPFIILKSRLDSHDQELHLAADKQLLCLFTSSLVKATLGLLSCYYVFMFNNPAGLKNIFLYLQKCILQIHDGKKLLASVITFVNEIDSLSKCS